MGLGFGASSLKDFIADFIAFVLLCFVILGCLSAAATVIVGISFGWGWFLGLLPGWAQFIANTLLVIVIFSLVGATINALHRTAGMEDE